MMDENLKKTTTSLSAFIIQQCRKFNLFPNENTTILSHGDELQVMQFCLTCQNKKNGETFEADMNTVVTLVDKIRRSHVLSIEQALQKAQIQEEALPANGPAAVHRPCVDSESVKTVDGSLEAAGSSASTDTDHSSTKEALVLTLCHEYKETNNHWTLMDVYSAFIKAMKDQTSDLYQAIVANGDVYKLQYDMEDNMQNKVLGFLQNTGSVHSDESFNVQNKTVSSNIPEEDGVPSSFVPDHRLLSPKTPVGKLQAAVNCFGKSPSEACVTMATPKTPFSPSTGRGLKEIFVEDLFRSYMHLLVNSRSQLALARVFNIPDRGLDHESFTHLKHEASACRLSMYQTLSSFMLRIRLGGQGYAPARDHPLMAYVKGLGLLLDMTQKLQMIIEEVPELSSACSRVVNVIKNNLIRCKSGKFPSKLVTPVSEKIHNKLLTIIQEMDFTVSTDSKILGHKCLLVIQNFLDRTALMESQLDELLMSDISFSSSTPTRFPCLLTLFRSPSVMDVPDKEEDCDNTDSNVNLRSLAGTNKHFVSAALYVDSKETSELLTQRTMSSIEILPSKTIIHPRAEVSGQAIDPLTQTNTSASTLCNVRNKERKVSRGKGSKRPAMSSLDKENIILSPTTNLPDPCKKMKQKHLSLNVIDQSSSQAVSASQLKKSTATSCRRRLLPQIKGQGKITGFFRV